LFYQLTGKDIGQEQPNFQNCNLKQLLFRTEQDFGIITSLHLIIMRERLYFKQFYISFYIILNPEPRTKKEKIFLKNQQEQLALRGREGIV
jgi:hypothetical protein